MVPTVNLDEFTTKFQEEILKIPYVHEHMMTRREREILVALASSFDKGNPIFEFGTWRGLTTHVLAVVTKKKIYTLDYHDLKKGKDSCNEFQTSEILSKEEIGLECKDDPNVKQILMDSAEFVPEEHMLSAMDLVLVDGNHSYKHIKLDAENGMKMLRTGGILILHDYSPSLPDGTPLQDSQSADVVKYVREMQAPWWHIKDTTFAFTIKIP